MTLIRELRGFVPKIGRDCYLAETCVVIGDVIIGDQSSIWYNTVIRGDVNSIRIGSKVNIQDNSVLHCTYEETTVKIGDNVSVGHNVIVHGANIESNVLIGMGAILMDNVKVGENSIIAAGSVVLEGTKVEPGSVYAGVPAKFIKKVSSKEANEQIKSIAARYVGYTEWYRNG